MLRDIYNKLFTEKGIYIGFYEYTLFQENLSIKTEKQIKRIVSNIDSIVSQIILLVKLEKAIDKEDNHQIIKSLHSSLLLNFSIIKNICDDFEMDANTEFDYNATIENMMAKYQLTKDQAIIIKKQWFSDVEKQFYAYVAGKNTLRIFPSNVDIRFQFKNDELENLLSYPTLSDSNGLIHSVSFFNLQFLLALFYIQTMVKCMSIELFKIEDYNKAIENAKKELFYDTAGFHYNFSNDEIYIILENFLDNNV
jgi:hypothetical protein